MTGTLPVLIIALGAVTAVAATAEPSRGPLKTALQPLVDRHALAGAVMLVADKEKVLDVETVGYQDVAARKPMRPDALFWIASQTKPITVTAFMMLVDEGKVKLDDPVSKYLPEFNNLWLATEQDNEHMTLKRPHRAITIRDILSHTSGLPFASALEQPTLDGLTLREAVHSYALTPLQFEPGSRYQYSNAGINTAGRIIEVVSGMPYEQFLQQRLLDPLGMKDTTFWPTKRQIARIAKSYKPDAANTGLEETTIPQLHYPLDDRSVRYPMPAGGLFSTAADVARFCQMILNGGVFEGKRYLSEGAVREMVTKQTGNLPDGYGLGWATSGVTYWHGGAFATNMEIDTKHGLIYVYLVQHAGFPADGASGYGAFVQAAQQSVGAH